jgi:hypothetical protein
VEVNDLASLDAKAPQHLRALNYDRPPPAPSHASPHAFVCSDGRTYWIKRKAQCGLIAELVAGRLGALLDAAPQAAAIVVAPEAMPTDVPAPNHLLGVGVGSADEPAMENFRHISEKAPDGNLDPARLDARSVTRVVVFQTWIGAGDTQILVDLRTGRLQSIDHGDLACVSNPGSAPALIVAPGLPPGVGRDPATVSDEVARIERLTDENLLQAVAGSPDDAEWQADPGRRLAIAEGLRLRRELLREVMEQWTT